ncbi:hypothetical protein ABZP36_033483 [Zizania latifolia]
MNSRSTTFLFLAIAVCCMPLLSTILLEWLQSKLLEVQPLTLFLEDGELLQEESEGLLKLPTVWLTWKILSTVDWPVQDEDAFFDGITGSFLNLVSLRGVVAQNLLPTLGSQLLLP